MYIYYMCMVNKVTTGSKWLHTGYSMAVDECSLCMPQFSSFDLYCAYLLKRLMIFIN